MQDFKKLSVWEKAHTLTILVYRLTANFPKDELYGLTSQIRRASVSIPANVAEGCGRQGNAELGSFLQIAFGSSCELEYYILLSHDLKFLTDEVYNNLNNQAVEIKKMLASLIQKTKTDN